jgi:hypothetical protein
LLLLRLWGKRLTWHHFQTSTRMVWRLDTTSKHSLEWYDTLTPGKHLVPHSNNDSLNSKDLNFSSKSWYRTNLVFHATFYQ